MSHDHFFVFLDQLAATVAECSTAVAEAVALYAVLFAHGHAVDDVATCIVAKRCLGDPFLGVMDQRPEAGDILLDLPSIW
jgi:hypothetical protein